MPTSIPYDKWLPLSVSEVAAMFADAPFQWGFAGGYAVEQFVGSVFREHDDIDVMVFRDDQLALQGWLRDWQLYAADPPGTLREWSEGEFLPYGIHDIWGHRLGSGAWQMQVMLAESEGDEWFSRRSPAIRGKREALLTQYNGLPCLRIEVQLMYKAKGLRPKDEIDFEASLPRMTEASRGWLKDQLYLLYPEGHPWLGRL